MSWKKVRLIDVCDFQGGTQPPKNEWSSEKKDGYIRMLQIRDFTQGQEKHVEYVKLTNTLKTCNEDDILIGRYGASIGKILTGLRGAYNVAIVKTIPSEKLNKKYLYHYLCSPKFQNFIQNAGSRAAQAGFNKSELAELFINLPPTCTQEKIASILDKADELRRKDQQLLAKYDELLQSIFYQMFGDAVKNEKGWQTVRLGEVVETRLGKMLDAKKISGHHLFKYLGNSNVLWNSFDLKNLKEMDFLPEERKEFDLRKSDILMCEGGEVGRCAIWKEEGSNIFFQKALHRIRVNKKMLNEHYFVWLMFNYSKSNGFKDYVSSVTISHLTGVKLKSMIIPLPPIQLQNEFAGKIASLEHQMTLCKLSVDKSESLFQSLLRKAFKGELVK